MMNSAIKFIRTVFRKNLFLSSLNAIYRNYFKVRRSAFGYIDKTATVRFPVLIKGIENVYLHENSHIMGDSIIISTKAKFIMMKNSASAERLTVVTGNHPAEVGRWFVDIAAGDEQEARDIVVEEDVWLSANVTLLCGTRICRGAIVGNGAVCRSSVPPYSIVIGNPAKVVGFRFTPDEILRHEMMLYPPEFQLDPELLKANYRKYFLDRRKEIQRLVKV